MFLRKLKRWATKKGILKDRSHKNTEKQFLRGVWKIAKCFKSAKQKCLDLSDGGVIDCICYNRAATKSAHKQRFYRDISLTVSSYLRMFCRLNLNKNRLEAISQKTCWKKRRFYYFTLTFINPPPPSNAVRKQKKIFERIFQFSIVTI